MLQPDWIPITAAADLLAERFVAHVSSDWMLAYVSAWASLTNRLASGELEAKPQSPDSYALAAIAPDGSREEVPLNGGVIPKLFWIHYCATRERDKRKPLITQKPSSRSEGGDFWFEDRGAADEFVVLGSAAGVLVQHMGLAADPEPPKRRGRGRPVGTGTFDDRELAQRGAAMVRTSGRWRIDVARELAPLATPSASPESTVHRLRHAISAALEARDLDIK